MTRAVFRCRVDEAPAPPRGLRFDSADCYLMCATHGALFDVDSGRCVRGPCAGARWNRSTWRPSPAS